MTGRRLAFIGAGLVAAACVERLQAPGHCPDFCPSGQVTISDTLLTTNIYGDSAFRGYVLAHQSTVMLAALLPGFPPSPSDTLDGRPIFRVNGVGSRFSISTADTSTGAILGADSARLQVWITRHDTATHNLRLALYRLPITIDSTTTFTDLAGSFTDSLLKQVNIDTLLTLPGRKDSVTGDSIVVDSLNQRLVLSLKLIAPAARYLGTDSGTVSYGIRIAADTLASIALGKGSLGPSLQWYLRVDSLGMPVARNPVVLGAPFASFVFTPPPASVDTTLAVGGVPSVQSMLRVNVPSVLKDSARIIRGTLILVPAVPARGAPGDSFVVDVRSVLADFGAKSPLDLRVADSTIIHPGSTDTVQIEVTNLMQVWALDATHPTILVLRPRYPVQSFGEIHFYPSRAPALRPALQVTYVRKFPFGQR